MPERFPTKRDLDAITQAMVHNFPPCNCHAHSGIIHACGAHAFVQEIDRIVPRWQKLLFYRNLAPRLREQEGLRAHEGTPIPEDERVLPW